jgi:(2Fe-2S) ferredoxin
LFICTNQRSDDAKRSCGEAHGMALVAEFKKQLKDNKGTLKVRANKSGCLGICDFGPTVAVYPEGTFYVGVKIQDVREIVEAHLLHGSRVERLVLKNE